MSQQQTEVNYKDTLNLPQTPFKMKANAAQREVELEQHWEERQVYQKMLADRSLTKKFVLHDGPPYLSSDKIHIGTALNKILKDIVTRYKSQHGFYTPYVPGYDGHGLPIENAVVKNIKGGRHAVTPVELRKRCREFALKNLAGQEANFKRLGVWGDWTHPYITIDAAFEATQIKVFGTMYEKGYVYKGLKPVYWCPTCETALADAEVEYADHTSHSVYVKFPICSVEGSILSDEFKGYLQGASFVIWTTTPWTLPANLALSVNPAFKYHLLATKFGKLLVAEDLVESFAQAVLGDSEYEAQVEFEGRELEHIVARHPFIDRGSPVLCGDHVTLEAGTGVVHTAPGHGMEDYLICQQYNRDVYKDNPIPVLSPLDNRGQFTEEAGVPQLVGVRYDAGNGVVLEILREKQALLAHTQYAHSYPHCWRCHKPVIYRATPQWFIDLDQFRGEALDAIEKVNWIPARGKNRIESMVEGRGDWCLSRQRVWGVPIPVFYYEDTDEPLITPEIIDHLYEQFKVHSSDLWWDRSAEELLAGLSEATRQLLGVGQRPLRKEMDIMDVWFDSGITHTAVVEARADELGHLPVELYLEGSDQHRGWFQSALLTSVMVSPADPKYGKAPYKSVLTHGFVLDEQGRKMSKSLGNVVDPNDVIKQYGADILRLWVASVDYTNDVRIGANTLHQMAEIYKKVRNTVRFILGSLSDFDPATDRVQDVDFSAFDRYTRHRLRHILGNVTEAFETYEFHRYSHEIQYLCLTDLSARYFDVAKDILYCDPTNGTRRRAVQTVLYEALSIIIPMLVPIMPHLAEDIWLNLPEHQRMTVNGEAPVSAVLLSWPQTQALSLPSGEVEKMDRLLALKETINQLLEKPRSEGVIGSSLEASVLLLPQSAECREILAGLSPSELATLFITSRVDILDGPASRDSISEMETPEFRLMAIRAEGEKCGRCWRYDVTVGRFPAHPQLCERCHQAVTALA